MESLGILKTRSKNGGEGQYLHALVQLYSIQHLTFTSITTLDTAVKKVLQVASTHFDLTLSKVCSREWALNSVLSIVCFPFDKYI